MKALVVYESMFGNTEKVARAIGEGLSEHGEVVLHDTATATPGDVADDVDLIVAGGPTHALSMSREDTRHDAIRKGARQGLVGQGLREWLTALDDLQGLSCATFDTRVSKARLLPGSAARAAARSLRRRGGRMVSSPQSFYVTDVAGPLVDDQLDRARSWGQQVGGLLADGDDGILAR